MSTFQTWVAKLSGDKFPVSSSQFLREADPGAPSRFSSTSFRLDRVLKSCVRILSLLALSPVSYFQFPEDGHCSGRQSDQCQDLDTTVFDAREPQQLQQMPLAEVARKNLEESGLEGHRICQKFCYHKRDNLASYRLWPRVLHCRCSALTKPGFKRPGHNSRHKRRDHEVHRLL